MSPAGSMSQSLTERYDDRIAGMLSCYDRLVITVVCYAGGISGECQGHPHLDGLSHRKPKPLALLPVNRRSADVGSAYEMGFMRALGPEDLCLHQR